MHRIFSSQNQQNSRRSETKNQNKAAVKYLNKCNVGLVSRLNHSTQVSEVFDFPLKLNRSVCTKMGNKYVIIKMFHKNTIFMANNYISDRNRTVINVLVFG